MMGNWDELQRDLIVLVAQRIGLLEDFRAFGGVCRSWRSAAVMENFKGCSRVPWLMLAEEEDEEKEEVEEQKEEEEKKNDVSRSFVWLTRGPGIIPGMIQKFSVPEAKGKRCVESLGWFVTISEQGEMNLIHPFSHVQINLPHLDTYRYLEGDYPMESNYFFLQKAVLSSSPSTDDNDYVLMVICGEKSRLAFWRPGDKLWTTIVTRDGSFCDVTYYKGQFYGVNYESQVFRCDVGGPDPTLARHVGGISGVNDGGKRAYIVELAGRLLVVLRDGCDLTFLPGYVDQDIDGGHFFEDESTVDYGATEFLVFEVDINNKWTCAEIPSLGDYTLFLGDNASISVDVSKFPEVKPNCIYYTDDNDESYGFYKLGGGKDMGIYNLEDRTRMPHYDGKQSLSPITPPIWVTPSFF